MKLELIAPTAFGLEAVTARELKTLGYEQTETENGRVLFWGDEYDVARTNLQLRTAARVLIRLASFPAVTFEELFQGVMAIPWEDWLPEDAAFPVDGRSVKSGLFSVSDCQAIVKKAIVERLKRNYRREIFEETGPLYRIEVSLLKDVATITLDTSGAGLHKRGYRKMTGEAPLKETMAAALLLLTYWKRDRLLLDPMCGTGTIPIEAALIARNQAPGLGRSFAAERWPNFSPDIWEKARQEAKDLLCPSGDFRIYGSDIDAKAVDFARACAKAAGVSGCVRLEQSDFRKLTSRESYGFLVTNPPYGERLGQENEVISLYREMGRVFRQLPDWSYYILSAHPEFEKYFGRKADRRRKLYNGRLVCQYYQYLGAKPPRKAVSI